MSFGVKKLKVQNFIDTKGNRTFGLLTTSLQTSHCATIVLVILVSTPFICHRFFNFFTVRSTPKIRWFLDIKLILPNTNMQKKFLKNRFFDHTVRIVSLLGWSRVARDWARSFQNDFEIHSGFGGKSYSTLMFSL